MSRNMMEREERSVCEYFRCKIYIESWDRECVERNSDVTRFGKILMISVQGLLSIWQNFEPTLVIF